MHNPGPWRKVDFDVLDANGERVIMSDGPGFGSKSDFPRAEANANLIMKSPELLEVAAMMLLKLKQQDRLEDFGLIEMAEQIINEATGG